MDGGRSKEIMHFECITDAYGWLRPINHSDTWHLKHLWAIIDDFKVNDLTYQRIGYNDPINPEDEILVSIYIQKVDDYNTPLPQE